MSNYDQLDKEVDNYYPPNHALAYWQKSRESLLKRLAIIDEKIEKLNDTIQTRAT